MKIGTRSVLFGAHQFLIHPLFVALAWWRLYGFPWDPRLWVAFFVHDLGYWGKPNMDGDEGEMHPLLGARIMSFLFDRPFWKTDKHPALDEAGRTIEPGLRVRNNRWFYFTLYHSRFLAKRDGVRPSKLCAADKLAVALEPWWLYLPRVILTGEIREYMVRRRHGKYAAESRGQAAPTSRREWHRRMSTYCYEWAYEHADGREDTWTPEVTRR